ncbi:MAG: hypothetical protein KKG03_06040 [Gammaproteobacteria bacterium]|nr:hypothetical protein [Sideroxydans sp.]MBU3903614.1 hypothetical protein [Gammaproteobacteria bacterium]MBU4045940.1 hypothetical protein [Gammaproteobacteria bacterium]MBU4151196.1 hypothetical protein [Gammaproteobacteria bacterium]
MKNWMLPAAILLAMSGGAWAEDDSYLAMSVGLERSSGKYGGTSTTDTTSIPVSLRYVVDDWSLKLSVPYLFVTGDGSVLVSGSRGGRRGSVTTTTTTSTTRTTSSGLGDVVAFASYSMLRSEEGDAGLDVAARIKFGTASTKFGSGENDYAVQASTYVAFGDFTSSLMLGYEKLGSTATAPLDNAAYGSLGLDYVLGDESNMGVEYWYAQQASATGYAQKELTLYARTQIGEDLTLNAFVMKGLSDGSPDTGYGVSLSSGF